MATAGSGQAGRLGLSDLGRTCVLAAGVGWMREEYELMGQEFTRSRKRLDRCRHCAALGVADGVVWSSGEHYQVPEMMIEPHPPAPKYMLAASPMRRCTRATVRWLCWERGRLGRGDLLRGSLPNCGNEMEGTVSCSNIMLALLETPDTCTVDKRAEDAGITAVMCAPWMGGELPGWRCRALRGAY